MAWRRVIRPRSLMLSPSINTRPALGSSSRNSSTSRDDLPAPLGPTTPMRSPPPICRDTCLSAGGRPAYTMHQKDRIKNQTNERYICAGIVMQCTYEPACLYRYQNKLWTWSVHKTRIFKHDDTLVRPFGLRIICRRPRRLLRYFVGV